MFKGHRRQQEGTSNGLKLPNVGQFEKEILIVMNYNA